MRVSRLFSKRALAFGAAGLIAIAATAVPVAVAQANPDRPKATAIKHVWLIILENKSYDATFTGLNDNTYLWKTLPAQGVLLKDY
jgi:phospholipase C